MKQRLAYHFTHLDNLGAVLEGGSLLCDSAVQVDNVLVRETADPDLKLRRRRVAVPDSGRVLADYVPFYFSPRSPMLLRVATGQVPGYNGGQDPLVFVVVDIDRVLAAGHTLMATDGHPVSPLTRFLATATQSSRVSTGTSWSPNTGTTLTRMETACAADKRRSLFSVNSL